MPESRQRKKADYIPPSGSQKAAHVGSHRWVAPAMVACWLFGLAWIVVYYIVPDFAWFGDLGNWNLVIGMGFIGAGFILSTRWQ